MDNDLQIEHYSSAQDFWSLAWFLALYWMDNIIVTSVYVSACVFSHEAAEWA